MEQRCLTHRSTPEQTVPFCSPEPASAKDDRCTPMYHTQDTQTETIHFATKIYRRFTVHTTGTPMGCRLSRDAASPRSRTSSNATLFTTATKASHIFRTTRKRQATRVGQLSFIVSSKLLPHSDLLRLVALVDEPREHVSVVDGEVVSLTVDVGRDHRCEVAPVLILRTRDEIPAAAAAAVADSSSSSANVRTVGNPVRVNIAALGAAGFHVGGLADLAGCSARAKCFREATYRVRATHTRRRATSWPSHGVAEGHMEHPHYIGGSAYERELADEAFEFSLYLLSSHAQDFSTVGRYMVDFQIHVTREGSYKTKLPRICPVPGDGTYTRRFSSKSSTVQRDAEKYRKSRQGNQGDRRVIGLNVRNWETNCGVGTRANLVAAVEDVDHALRVRVALVAGVRGAVVDHGLVDGVGGLVGEDARRQAGHQLDNLEGPAALHHVVVDEDVLAEELHLVLEVAEQPPDLIDAWKQVRRAVCDGSDNF